MTVDKHPTVKRKTRLEVSRRRLEEQKISCKMQVPSSKLQVVSEDRSQRFVNRCRKIKSDRSAVEWFSVHRMKNLFFQSEDLFFVLG